MYRRSSRVGPVPRKEEEAKTSKDKNKYAMEEDIIKKARNKTLYFIFKQITKENYELEAENKRLKEVIEILRESTEKKVEAPKEMVVHFFKGSPFA